MGCAPTWLRLVSPPPASQHHFNHWCTCGCSEIYGSYQIGSV